MSNPLQAAVAAVAPQLASAFVAYIESNKPAIEARITAAGTTAITYVENAILSAVPSNGVVATIFKPEITSVVNGLAKSAIAAAGGDVAALIALAEMEVTSLGNKLASS